MKTLTDLKRDAKARTIKLELIERYMGLDIPETMQGIRDVVDANSVEIQLLNSESKISHLRLPCASLVEYTDNELTIFDAGLRDLTEHEQSIMNEWKQIENTEEYKRQAEIDILGDGSTTYYQELRFYRDRDSLYLMGNEEQRGMTYDYRENKIKDNKVKGDAILKYKVYRTES